VVQLPPVVVSHTQYTTTKRRKSLVTYELVNNYNTNITNVVINGDNNDETID
jgi:hypothetical protein